MNSQNEEEILLHNFEIEYEPIVFAGEPEPERKPVVSGEEVLLPDDFVIEYEPIVFGDEEIESEAATRARLHRPLSWQPKSLGEMAVCGSEKPESISLPKGEEEKEKVGVAPQTDIEKKKTAKEKLD